MNNLDFAGSNLIFTMTTGKHVYLINVVHRLICLDICDHSDDIHFYIMSFPKDLVKVNFVKFFFS